MITLVAAVARNGVIGNNGDIPWAGKLRTDMHFFKTLTMGKTVVMGRKTFVSLPARFRPLPGRQNVILTRDPLFSEPNCLILNHANEILRLALHVEEVAVIGGSEIYELMMPFAQKLVITHLHSPAVGDTFFPSIYGSWNARTLHIQPQDAQNLFSFSIIEYTR